LSRSEGGIFFRKIVKQWQSDLSQIQECTKPVIAATHGRCIGGGVDLVTGTTLTAAACRSVPLVAYSTRCCVACDIRLCTEDATFCVAETKMAMVADIGTLQRITKIVGKGLAREMVRNRPTDSGAKGEPTFSLAGCTAPGIDAHSPFARSSHRTTSTPSGLTALAW
jgi:enoyl-CoA hydratase/carnithine racemase